MNIPADAEISGSSNCSIKISNQVLVAVDTGNNAHIPSGGTMQLYIEFITANSNFELTFLQLNGIQMNLSGQTVKPTAIYITEEDVTLFQDQTHDFTIRFEPYNGEGTVTWSCSDTSIATITSDTGVLTAKAPGSCIITATCEGLTATCDVVVKSNIVQTQNLEIKFVASGGAWPASSGYNVNYAVQVHNISNAPIANWECDIVLPAGSGVNQAWNATITNTSGTTYHIVGSSNQIQPGTTASDTGMILIVPTTTYIPIPINITP